MTPAAATRSRTQATTTVRAAVYTRISADAEGRGLGVARQESDCRALVERRGWELVEVYCDNDLSAFSTRKMKKVRPAYRRLFADVEGRRVDAVVAWHPDRINRTPRELEDFIDLIEATGALVATCTSGDYDLGNPDGRLMARIVGSVARKESEDKSRRLRRKHQELAENGKVSGGGQRPFGYESDRVTIRADEAALVREAATRIIEGESLRGVVLDWKRRGIPTVTGAAWSPTTLQRLLTSGRIAGERTHHGEVTAPAAWPAIITGTDAERVRSILGQPRTRGGSATATPRSYLLSGLVTCGACGARLTARPVVRKGIRYRRYVCAVDRGGCGRVGIGAAPLEELVTEALLLRLDSPQMAAAIEESADDEIAELQLALSADRQAHADLVRAHFEERIITKAEFAAARARLESRIESMEADLGRRALGAGAWAGRGAALRSTWAEVEFDRRRAVVVSLIERIPIAPTTRANNRFDPDRVDVIWRA